MKKLKFYDVKVKKKFESSEYRTVRRNNKKGRVVEFAVAKSPFSDVDAWRILSNKPK